MNSTEDPWAIKAIDTNYAGCRFRSRLEARFAVFLDHLGIKWEYEPEGYALPSGHYLPDFLLPDVGARGSWLEIKPDSTPRSADTRWTELSIASGMPVFVAHGLPRHDENLDYTQRIEMFSDVGWDDSYAFCLCDICGKVGIQYCGRDERNCRPAHGPEVEHWSANDPRILNAYTAARSARFEHGAT